ncbi:unnamed protein product, partial [Sphagnum jensenii]
KWADEDDLFSDEEEEGEEGLGRGKKDKAQEKESKREKGPGWGDDDLDIRLDPLLIHRFIAPLIATFAVMKRARAGKGAVSQSAPQGGAPATVFWCSESSHAADHFAAGSVQTALQLLSAQIALANAAPLRAGAKSLFLGSMGHLPGLPLAPSNRVYLQRAASTPAGKGAKSVVGMPALTLRVTELLLDLKEAYRTFAEAQFDDCRVHLDRIIAGVPLVVAPTRAETNDLKGSGVGGVLHSLQAAAGAPAARAQDCDGHSLQEQGTARYLCSMCYVFLHRPLIDFILVFCGVQNFINAASFARRLLELPEMSAERNADSRLKAQKARRIVSLRSVSVNASTTEHSTLKPIYKGSPSVKCPYCLSTYSPEYKGKTCLTCSISTGVTSNIYLVHQDDQQNGAVSSINDSGLIVSNSTSFRFSWPLLEMTSDPTNRDIYVITYPADVSGPELFMFDQSLKEIHSWTNIPFSFFDLQYSTKQANFYGILVTSQYGRTISKFVADVVSNSVTASQLFTLPYMWYVNASSFDQTSNRYLALMNNFPGQANSTLSQQLVISETLDEMLPAQFTVIPLSFSSVLVQFVAYSAFTQCLYGAGLQIKKTSATSYDSMGSASVLVLDPITGASTVLATLSGVLEVGPLTASQSALSLNLFVRVKSIAGSDSWQLWRVSPADSSTQLVASYTESDYARVAAACELAA